MAQQKPWREKSPPLTATLRIASLCHSGVFVKKQKKLSAPLALRNLKVQYLLLPAEPKINALGNAVENINPVKGLVPNQTGNIFVPERSYRFALMSSVKTAKCKKMPKRQMKDKLVS